LLGIRKRKGAIKVKKITATLAAIAAVFTFSSAASAQHYVQSGETFYKISQEYKMNLKDLISLNPHIKDPNKIKVGDYIVIRSGVETAADLVDYAKSLQYVTAYKYGGTNPPYETDCSGWAQHVFKKFGVSLPRVSRDQAKTGTPVKFENLQVGDLMFFSIRPDKTITHVGIYLGNDYWISNLNQEKDVEILSTWGKWSREHFLYGTRHKL
jgi:cell wall-associated NlpC family hydrolase